MLNKMIQSLLNFVTSSERTAITSIISAVTGQLVAESSLNVALQRMAWIVAILAGILTMINLFFPLRQWYDKRNNKTNS